MTDAFHIARVGLGAQDQALDVLASNIANVNTVNFKRMDASFTELVAIDPSANTLRTSGVKMHSAPSYAIQGELQVTGHPLDIAIDGPGYIELLGPGGEVHLWRGGRLSVAADGQLSTASGHTLRAFITAPFDTTALAISPDGVVSAQTSEGETLELGEIRLVRVTDEAVMQPVSAGVMRVTDASTLRDTRAGEDGSGRLMQAMVERSNVDLNTEMVTLMIVQRAYAANAQVLQVADQLLSIANNLRQR